MFPFEEKSGLNIPNRFNEHAPPQLDNKEELQKVLKNPSYPRRFTC